MCMHCSGTAANDVCADCQHYQRVCLVVVCTATVLCAQVLCLVCTGTVFCAQVLCCVHRYRVLWLCAQVQHYQRVSCGCAQFHPCVCVLWLCAQVLGRSFTPLDAQDPYQKKKTPPALETRGCRFTRFQEARLQEAVDEVSGLVGG
jgi:hypothetical protein